MKKAPEAFRTISEVAEILETPAHVLRFWESKFYQIRPVKRAGGRRYYRPDDVALINGIRALLQDQGMTIRGVQRILQENGVKHVAALGGPLSLDTPEDHLDTIDGELAENRDDTASAAGDMDVEDTVSLDSAAAEPNKGADALDVSDAETIEASAEAATGSESERHADDRDAAPEPATLDLELPEVPAPPQAAAPLPSETAPATAEDTPMIDPETPVPAIETAPGAEQPEPEQPPGKPSPHVDMAALVAPPDFDDGLPELPSDRARIARRLRVMPRGRLGEKRDPLERLGRRIDALLERMSEASGAGRW